MSENETEPKFEKYIDENLRTARLAAFLDFYSDRATAHASLFVASLFGLFTLLAIVQKLKGLSVWGSTFIYFALTYAGYFTLVRFSFYADISEKITVGLEQSLTLRTVKLSTDARKTVRNLCDYLGNRSKQQRKILLPKEMFRRLGRGGGYLLALTYWITTSFFGLIVYSEVLTHWEEWTIWIAIFVVLTSIFVILPYWKSSVFEPLFEKADKVAKRKGWK